MIRDPSSIIEAVTARHARFYKAAVLDLLVAMARGDRVAAAGARERLQQAIVETMGIGEAIGAASMLRTAARVLTADGGANMRRHGADLLRFRETPELASVTFEEALQDLIDRTPAYLRDAAERTAQNISRLYSEGRVIAFAKSAEQAVTQRAQDLIVQAVRDGLGELEAGRTLRMGVEEIRKLAEPWSDAYSRMAFRTNVNTAVTAGRFRQAQDPDIRAVAPAFRFVAVGDSDTRDNHGAANGLVFRVDNPVWNRIAPPIGYNCRCTIEVVTLPELRRSGRLGRQGVVEDRLPAGAFPDPGFRHTGRPDLFIVGASA